MFTITLSLPFYRGEKYSKEIRELAHGHAPGTRQSKDINLYSLSIELMLLTTMHGLHVSQFNTSFSPGSTEI